MLEIFRLKSNSYIFHIGLCIWEAFNKCQLIPGEILVCNAKIESLALRIMGVDLITHKAILESW